MGETMTEQKRLYRSKTDKQWAGVCGGLGEYLNIDSTLVRLVFVALTLMGGPGLVLYIIMWLVVPENPEDDWDEYEEDDYVDMPELVNIEKMKRDDF
jgi:phage shock protein C